MSRHRARRSDGRPHGHRTREELEIAVSWETGPRTDAWDALWRRLLAAILDDFASEAKSNSGATERRPGDEPEPRCSSDR